MRQTHLSSSRLKCITDVSSIEQKPIERVSESYDGIILHLVVLMNADYVLCSSLLENLADEL